jgi:hypothetical protein
MIQHLQRLPTEVVERFLEIRDAKKVGIPQGLAEYILQVNEASNLLRRNPSITECARMLQKSYRTLSISTCKARIYDAINYFNADCSVTSEAWNMYFADQSMKLMEVNLVAHNFTEARKCIEDARAWRLQASANAINPDRIKFKPQIVSADMQLDRMGVTKQGVLATYEKALKLINEFDISSNDKDRLKGEVSRELNVEEAEYENA